MPSIKSFAFAALFLVAAQHAAAESRTDLTLQTHAEFFSTEVKLAAALDPQVFVLDGHAHASVGPQGIAHVDGVRNALVSDARALPLYDAHRRPLHMTLGNWLSARGSVTLTSDSDGRETIVVRLSGLKPNGLYSLFENHFDQQPVGFTPLDGSADGNTFRADVDGNAVVSITSPGVLTHANAVLVVYHSDDAAHGSERGAIGVDAHHQLIARLP
jgi:hypothetical protein